MGLVDTLKRWLVGKSDHVSVVPTGPAPGPVFTEHPPFPYPLVTVHGSKALATWQTIRDAGDCWPVVLGSDEDVECVREGIEDIDERGVDKIVQIATGLSFPQSLKDARAEDHRRALEFLRSQGTEIEDDSEEPEVGDWPDAVETTELTVASDYTGGVHDRVHIALLPCKTGWDAIAHLRWGGWNDNPGAEHHFAALKSWNERYGAELVGCSRDVLNLRVTRRPATRDEALALAREQYLYCSDIVDQGVGSLSALAATLMAGDWWFLWWD